MDSTPEKSNNDSILSFKNASYFESNREFSCRQISGRACRVNELEALTPSPLSGQHQTGAAARDDRHREQLLVLVHLALRSASPSPLHQQLVSQWPLSPPMARRHQNRGPRLFFLCLSLFFPLIFFRPPHPHSFQPKWLFRVTVWMCITVLKLIIWRKIKYV